MKELSCLLILGGIAVCGYSLGLAPNMDVWDINTFITGLLLYVLGNVTLLIESLFNNDNNRKDNK